MQFQWSVNCKHTLKDSRRGGPKITAKTLRHKKYQQNATLLLPQTSALSLKSTNTISFQRKQNSNELLTDVSEESFNLTSSLPNVRGSRACWPVGFINSQTCFIYICSSRSRPWGQRSKDSLHKQAPLGEHQGPPELKGPSNRDWNSSTGRNGQEESSPPSSDADRNSRFEFHWYETETMERKAGRSSLVLKEPISACFILLLLSVIVLSH